MQPITHPLDLLPDDGKLGLARLLLGVLVVSLAPTKIQQTYQYNQEHNIDHKTVHSSQVEQGSTDGETWGWRRPLHHPCRGPDWLIILGGAPRLASECSMPVSEGRRDGSAKTYGWHRPLPPRQAVVSLLVPVPRDGVDGRHRPRWREMGRWRVN